MTRMMTPNVIARQPCRVVDFAPRMSLCYCHALIWLSFEWKNSYQSQGHVHLKAVTERFILPYSWFLHLVVVVNSKLELSGTVLLHFDFLLNVSCWFLPWSWIDKYLVLCSVSLKATAIDHFSCLPCNRVSLCCCCVAFLLKGKFFQKQL